MTILDCIKGTMNSISTEFVNLLLQMCSKFGICKDPSSILSTTLGKTTD